MSPRGPTHDQSGKRIAVRCVDMIAGESVTITVYGAELRVVAAYTAEQLAKRWRATKLNDGRHKRRR